jgi:cysteinyl-tRNA synthetase
VAPVVDAALSLRAVVRAEQRYDLSDLLRDELAAAGVEVRDTGEGVEWELRAGS